MVLVWSKITHSFSRFTYHFQDSYIIFIFKIHIYATDKLTVKSLSDIPAKLYEGLFSLDWPLIYYLEFSSLINLIFCHNFNIPKFLLLFIFVFLTLLSHIAYSDHSLTTKFSIRIQNSFYCLKSI